MFSENNNSINNTIVYIITVFVPMLISYIVNLNNQIQNLEASLSTVQLSLASQSKFAQDLLAHSNELTQKLINANHQIAAKSLQINEVISQGNTAVNSYNWLLSYNWYILGGGVLTVIVIIAACWWGSDYLTYETATQLANNTVDLVSKQTGLVTDTIIKHDQAQSANMIKTIKALLECHSAELSSQLKRIGDLLSQSSPQMNPGNLNPEAIGIINPDSAQLASEMFASLLNTMPALPNMVTPENIELTAAALEAVTKIT